MWCDVYARIREVLSDEQARRHGDSVKREVENV
jgi:hypothetical protein